jgi:hypothetical protein
MAVAVGFAPWPKPGAIRLFSSPIDQAEVLSLAAIAQSLFVSTTLESRTLDRVEDCRQLWSEAARLFGELCDSWAGIESGDQSIAWLRGRLAH